MGLSNSFSDPRSLQGMFSRGRPVASMTTFSPNYKGGPVRGAAPVGSGNPLQQAAQRRLGVPGAFGGHSLFQNGPLSATPKDPRVPDDSRERRTPTPKPEREPNEDEGRAPSPQSPAPAPNVPQPIPPPDINTILQAIQTPQISNPGLGSNPGRFNAEFEALLRQLAGEQSRAVSGANIGLSRLTQDFRQGVGDLERSRVENIDTLRNNLGSQGILRSGINIEEQGNINQDFGRGINYLGQQFARGQEDIQRGASDFLSQIQEQLGIAQAGATRTEAERQLQEALEQARLEALQRALGGSNNTMQTGPQPQLPQYRGPR